MSTWLTAPLAEDGAASILSDLTAVVSAGAAPRAAGAQGRGALRQAMTSSYRHRTARGPIRTCAGNDPSATRL